MKKNILLTIITEDQTKKRMAEKLSEVLKKEVGEDFEILNIEYYTKFENSFKIELKKLCSDKTKEELNLLLINIADRIASPWLVYFDSNQNAIELIFNKAESNRIRKNEFNVIKWGQIQIVE